MAGVLHDIAKWKTKMMLQMSLILRVVDTMGSLSIYKK
jgi:hypothetical protein